VAAKVMTAVTKGDVFILVFMFALLV
jgi:hypothetical protein